MSATLHASRFAAAFEGTRLRLLSAGLFGDGRPSHLAFTAIGRGEGITTCALGTAAALAAHGEQGPVLVIDGSPVGTRMAEMLALPQLPVAPDAGPEAVTAAVSALPFQGLSMLSLTVAPPALGDSRSEAWAETWEVLRSRFGRIVVDAGSLRSDGPRRWASWVGSTVLVIDTSRVTREALSAFGRERRQAGPVLAGFVLNKRRFHVPAALYRALT